MKADDGNGVNLVKGGMTIIKWWKEDQWYKSGTSWYDFMTSFSYSAFTNHCEEVLETEESTHVPEEKNTCDVYLVMGEASASPCRLQPNPNLLDQIYWGKLAKGGLRMAYQNSPWRDIFNLISDSISLLLNPFLKQIDFIAVVHIVQKISDAVSNGWSIAKN